MVWSFVWKNSLALKCKRESWIRENRGSSAIIKYNNIIVLKTKYRKSRILTTDVMVISESRCRRWSGNGSGPERDANDCPAPGPVRHTRAKWTSQRRRRPSVERECRVERERNGYNITIKYNKWNARAWVSASAATGG